MAGMYEKLGDLLNETLAAGHVKFVHVGRDEATEDAASPATDGGQSAGAGDFARSFYRAEAEAERRYFRTSRGDVDLGGRRRVIYRHVSPELEKAYALLGLDSTADRETVKRAYKEKLLYYHPDRYAGKELMEKIANDKTRELVASYKRIMEFLG